MCAHLGVPRKRGARVKPRCLHSPTDGKRKPLRLIVEARLSGAGASKVSANQGEEEVLPLQGRTTLNTAFHKTVRAGEIGGESAGERDKREGEMMMNGIPIQSKQNREF